MFISEMNLKLKNETFPTENSAGIFFSRGMSAQIIHPSFNGNAAIFFFGPMLPEFNRQII
jgi:hypothetical protein